jgi:hypothetical protein
MGANGPWLTELEGDTMQKWEYKFLGFEVLSMHSMFVRDSDLPVDQKVEDQTHTRNVYHLVTDYLNQAGEQGWELVGIEATGWGSGAYVLKRPKPERGASAVPGLRSSRLHRSGPPA